MCSGREFQVWAAATGKARLPTVASLAVLTMLVLDNLACRLFATVLLRNNWLEDENKRPNGESTDPVLLLAQLLSENGR